MGRTPMTPEEKALKAKEREEAKKKEEEEKKRKLEELKRLREIDVIEIESTVGDKKDFEKKCEDMGIAPQQALQLLLKGFMEDKFQFVVKKEWSI